MKNSEFKTYHPIVNFVYFVAVIGFSMVFLHPVYLLISFSSAFLYSVMLKGTKTIKSNLLYMIPVVLITALLNPLFNHQGMTVLLYLPDGNPLTAEAIAYGLCTAVMIVSVICWFSCFNEIITSDKFIYLFSKIIPALSLVLSMTLRFVPRFVKQFRQTAHMHKISGRKKGKIASAVGVTSAVLGWSLENSVDTSDSMRARGYGLPGRTSFSIFRFDRRDLLALVSVLCLSVCIIAGSIFGAAYFNFYPVILYVELSVYTAGVMVLYAILCFMPICLEFWEVRKWKRLISKI